MNLRQCFTVEFFPLADIASRPAGLQNTTQITIPASINREPGHRPFSCAKGGCDEQDQDEADVAPTITNPHRLSKGFVQVLTRDLGRLAAPAGDDGAAETLSLELSPVQIETEADLPEEVKQAIRAGFAHAHDNFVRNYERMLEQYKGPNRPNWMSKPVKPQPCDEK